MSNFDVQIRFRAKDETRAASESAQRRLRSFEKQAKAANRAARNTAITHAAMAKSTNAAAYAMGTLTRYVGPAVVGAAMLKTVKQAAHFEEALFGIQKKSGATAEQLGKVKEEIFDLASRMPSSVDGIAAAYERGAAAGIPLDQLKDFAELTAKVADAWDMAEDAVGNAFAGFNKGMNIPLKDMERFADVINYLADSGISDEKDIVNFLDRIGAQGRNVGLTAEQTAALGATMINLKMPADIAARAMDGLFGKLVAPENLSKKSRGALKEIVGDLDGFAKTMAKDPMGGILSFIEKLEKLNGQKRISLLGALMGEGFDDEMARLAGGADELRRNLELIKDTKAFEGSISALSEQRLDMFNSKLQITMNHLNGIATAGGNIVLPWLNDGLEILNETLSYQDAVNRGHREAGRGFMEATWWNTTHSEQDKRLLAFSQGWRSEEGRRAGKRDMTTSPELASAKEGARNAYNAPVLPPLPTFREDAPVPVKPRQRAPYRPGLMPVYVGGKTPRDAEDSSIQALRRDGSAVADAIDSALAQGGERAASRIADSGQAAGDKAGAAMVAQAAAIGTAIGNAAAAQIRTAVSNATITVKAASGVRADVGKAGKDVNAPSNGN
ncbi:MAG: phage tail tape measure protein [Notoacmeibacter sp.]|nr:phage tail tape measure protein [Notoacmeibacter sp.]